MGKGRNRNGTEAVQQLWTDPLPLCPCSALVCSSLANRHAHYKEVHGSGGKQPRPLLLPLRWPAQATYPAIRKQHVHSPYSPRQGACRCRCCCCRCHGLLATPGGHLPPTWSAAPSRPCAAVPPPCGCVSSTSSTSSTTAGRGVLLALAWQLPMRPEEGQSRQSESTRAWKQRHQRWRRERLVLLHNSSAAPHLLLTVYSRSKNSKVGASCLARHAGDGTWHPAAALLCLLNSCITRQCCTFRTAARCAHPMGSVSLAAPFPYGRGHSFPSSCKCSS